MLECVPTAVKYKDRDEEQTNIEEADKLITPLSVSLVDVPHMSGKRLIKPLSTNFNKKSQEHTSISSVGPQHRKPQTHPRFSFSKVSKLGVPAFAFGNIDL